MYHSCDPEVHRNRFQLFSSSWLLDVVKIPNVTLLPPTGYLYKFKEYVKRNLSFKKEKQKKEANFHYK